MVAELTTTVGFRFTLTFATALPEHPFIVPVTVYDVVDEGLTTTGFIGGPVFHE
jgi:hypothetical protein